jgi:hypothetical protein
VFSFDFIGHTRAMWHRSIGAPVGLRVWPTSSCSQCSECRLVSHERPVAYVFAGLAWLAAFVLADFVRFTDPYARPRGKRRGSRSAHSN